MNQRALSSWWWVAARKEADRNTSVLSEGFWGGDSLAGFHRIRWARKVIRTEWNSSSPLGEIIWRDQRSKIIYAPNIRSPVCYMSIFNRKQIYIWFFIIQKIVNHIFLYFWGWSLYFCLGVSMYIFFYWPIGIMVRVSTNGPGDRSSILDQFAPKTQKWYFIPPRLTQGGTKY